MWEGVLKEEEEGGDQPSLTSHTEHGKTPQGMLQTPRLGRALSCFPATAGLAATNLFWRGRGERGLWRNVHRGGRQCRGGAVQNYAFAVRRTRRQQTTHSRTGHQPGTGGLVPRGGLLLLLESTVGLQGLGRGLGEAENTRRGAPKAAGRARAAACRRCADGQLRSWAVCPLWALLRLLIHPSIN